MQQQHSRLTTSSIDVMEPAFVRNFSCQGTECPDHCCHSWTVTVNKTSFKNLRKNKDVVIRELAKTNLKLNRNAGVEHAKIEMDNKGECPFLDENSLCEIHKRLGHKALPHTCQDYPRSYNWFGEHVEASLHMSCPSVAREILLNPEALYFESRKDNVDSLNHGHVGGYVATAQPAWMPILRDFCFNTVLNDKLEFNERLFVIGILLKQATPHLDDPLRLKSLVNNFHAMTDDGTLQQTFTSLTSIPALRWQVFQHLDHAFIGNTTLYAHRPDSEGLSISSLRFRDCRQPLLSLLRNENKEMSIEDEGRLFEDILDQANQKLLPDYFNNHPHVLVNYVLYYLYHYQFMLRNEKSVFEFFRLMVVDLFMLKSYLAGIAVQQGEITDDWVVKLFQSYARRQQHAANFTAQVEAQLSQAGTDGAGPIFALLKD